MTDQYINDIKRYLCILEKSFNEATTCATCNESCCDIFHNIKKKIFCALDKLEEECIGECDMCTNNDNDSCYCENECYEEDYECDDEDYECYDECDFCSYDNDEDCTSNSTCECICNCTCECTCEPPNGGPVAYESRSIYLTSFVEQEVERLEPLSFENTPVQNEEENFYEKTSDTRVRIKQIGYYSFSIYVSPQVANETVALFLNDVEIPLTRYTARSASSILVGTGIFSTTEIDSILKVVNVSDKTLKIETGKLENTISTSLLLTKL